MHKRVSIRTPLKFTLPEAKTASGNLMLPEARTASGNLILSLHPP